MAKYIGLLTSDMRGKIGGIVTSRGRTGTTIKAKAVPAGQPTLLQNNIRVQVASATYAWRLLSNSERNSWGAIANTLLWTNSLANTFTPTALQLWTQAYVNASYFGTTPATTATGYPSDIVPIVSAELAVVGAEVIALVSSASGEYTGSWLLYVSAAIKSSRNYTKTISRKNVAAVTDNGDINIAVGYLEAFGYRPTAGQITAARFVPVLNGTYYSGTPYLANLTYLA
jgi:hypothetical protein